MEMQSDSRPQGYPRDIPQNFDEMTDHWDQLAAAWTTRLVICAPDVYPWAEIVRKWNLALHYTVRPGQRRLKVGYDEIVRLLSASVAGIRSGIQLPEYSAEIIRKKDSGGRTASGMIDARCGSGRPEIRR